MSDRERNDKLAGPPLYPVTKADAKSVANSIWVIVGFVIFLISCIIYG